MFASRELAPKDLATEKFVSEGLTSGTETSRQLADGGLGESLMMHRTGFTSWAHYEAATTLLSRGKSELHTARLEQSADRCFAAAHVAAIRVAAAVLAMRARKKSPSGVQNVWSALRKAAPELTPWVAYFERSAKTRGRIEAGLRVSLSGFDAQLHIRHVQQFIADVQLVLDLD